MLHSNLSAVLEVFAAAAAVEVGIEVDEDGAVLLKNLVLGLGF
jgi:hypothetical protein